MDCQRRAKSLVVLTLLQLCRAEIKDVQPQWYSANIINDAFQPKSISELFSSEPSFSTSNPIIVSSEVSNSLSDDIKLLSTMSSPTSMSDFSNTTPSPLGFSVPTTYPSSSQSPPLQQQYVPQNEQTSPQNFEQLQTKSPVPNLVELQSPVQPQQNEQIEQGQYTSQSLLPNPPEIKLTTSYQSPSTERREMRFEFPEQTQTSLEPLWQTTPPTRIVPPLSNYFLIYQHAPQSMQRSQIPSSSPQTTAGESFTTTATPSMMGFFPSTFSPSTTFQTTSSTMGSPTNPNEISNPISIGNTSPPYYSTTVSSVTLQPSPPPTPRVTVTSLSTIGINSSSMNNNSGTRLLKCMTPSSTTPIPTVTASKAVPMPFGGMYPLKIRVQTPRGSITNVHFNPVISRPAPTTQKSVTITVTRKPTTSRTPRPRRNTYDRCIQGCRKNGQNLCAAPLTVIPIDPNTLRGFPSVCHMACHNSYRKDPYEKISDGSCGRLRTRIRPIDSNSKLKRDELNRVKYFLDNSQQPAIIELSGVYK